MPSLLVIGAVTKCMQVRFCGLLLQYPGVISPVVRDGRSPAPYGVGSRIEGREKGREGQREEERGKEGGRKRKKRERVRES